MVLPFIGMPGCSLPLFSRERISTQRFQLNIISIFIEEPKYLRLSQEVLLCPGQVERLQAQISTRH